MAQILQFPAPESKRGFKRVRRRSCVPDNPDQLQLFAQPTAQILRFTPQLSPFEHALLFDERGDPKAAELYLKAIEEGDCPADAYCNLGIIESQRGNIAKAFDCFTLSLKSNPRHSEAHYNLGNLYFEANDLRLAQLHYEIAGEVDPYFANVHFNLALVQAISNDLDAAEKAIAKYRQLVSTEEAAEAEQLFEGLKRSVSTQSLHHSAARRPKGTGPAG